jgi:hypothetical protein
MTHSRPLVLLAVPLFLGTGISSAQNRNNSQSAKQDNSSDRTALLAPRSVSGTDARSVNGNGWMVEVDTPDDKPDYLPVSDADFDDSAGLELHPNDGAGQLQRVRTL